MRPLSLLQSASVLVPLAAAGFGLGIFGYYRLQNGPVGCCDTA